MNEFCDQEGRTFVSDTIKNYNQTTAWNRSWVTEAIKNTKEGHSPLCCVPHLLLIWLPGAFQYSEKTLPSEVKKSHVKIHLQLIDNQFIFVIPVLPTCVFRCSVD